MPNQALMLLFRELLSEAAFPPTVVVETVMKMLSSLGGLTAEEQAKAHSAWEWKLIMLSTRTKPWNAPQPKPRRGSSIIQVRIKFKYIRYS
jgi:hypothetical protein